MASGIGTISGGSSLLSAESSDSTESLEKTFQMVDTGKVAEDQNVDGGAQSQKDDNYEKKLDILAENDESNADHADGQNDAGQIQFDLTTCLNDHKKIIRKCKLIGRETAFLWTVFYFLWFHESNEVTTKYYGLYFGVFCTIIGAEAIFSHKIGHYKNLESLDYFNYPLKVLFSVFVSFVGEIEGRPGRLSLLQPQPRTLTWLPLTMFTIELGIPLLIIASELMIENRPFWNEFYSRPITACTIELINEDSAKISEIRRQEKEIILYFGKKWLVDFVIVFGASLLAHLPDQETKMPILHLYGIVILMLIRTCSLVLFCRNRTRTN